MTGGTPSTLVVNNTGVTSSSVIFLTRQSSGTTTPVISSKSTGTFTISTNISGDTGYIGYMVVNTI